MFKEIRNSTVALLKGQTLAGDKVFDTPVGPSESATIPCMGVFVASGSASNLANIPAFSILATIQIEVFANNADDLDALIEDIHRILFSSEQWCSQFTNIESISFDNSPDGNASDPILSSVIKINAYIFKSYVQ